jgi:hypothetical protein
MASPEGGILVVFYYPSASETFDWSGLIRGVASPEGGILVVFYYPSASETFDWSGLIRGWTLLRGAF